MASFDAQRRQLFHFTRKDEKLPLRPPWALNETLFQDACTRCGDCLASCPENILQRENPNGYPMVNFDGGECTFCKQCVDICPTNALNLSVTPLWSAKAIIKDACLTRQGVICSTCAEQCDEAAIQFTPQFGKVSQPQLDINTCTGCGACVAFCPTQAIEVHP